MPIIRFASRLAPLAMIAAGALAVPAKAAAQSAGSGPFLPSWQLRHDAQTFIEEVDVRMTESSNQSYVDSCAKFTRSMGVCTYTTMVDYDDGTSFDCHGKVRITLTVRGWVAHAYGYRCG